VTPADRAKAARILCTTCRGEVLRYQDQTAGHEWWCPRREREVIDPRVREEA
jgi:hypothetical protein